MAFAIFNDFADEPLAIGAPHSARSFAASPQIGEIKQTPTCSQLWRKGVLARPFDAEKALLVSDASEFVKRAHMEDIRRRPVSMRRQLHGSAFMGVHRRIRHTVKRFAKISQFKSLFAPSRAK